MRENTYVGSTVTIDMADDRTADSAPSGRSGKRGVDAVGRNPPLLRVIRLYAE